MLSLLLSPSITESKSQQHSSKRHKSGSAQDTESDDAVRSKIQRSMEFWIFKKEEFIDMMLKHRPDLNLFIKDMSSILQPQGSRLIIGIPTVLQSHVYSFLSLSDHISFAATCTTSQSVSRLPTSSPYLIQFGNPPLPSAYCIDLSTDSFAYMKPQSLSIDIDRSITHFLQTICSTMDMTLKKLHLSMPGHGTSLQLDKYDLDCFTVLKKLDTFQVSHGGYQTEVEFTPLLLIPSLTNLDIESPSLESLVALESTTIQLKTLRLENEPRGNIKRHRDQIINSLASLTTLTHLHLYCLSALSPREICSIATSLSNLTHLGTMFPQLKKVKQQDLLLPNFSSKLVSIDSWCLDTRYMTGISSLTRLNLENRGELRIPLNMKWGGSTGNWKSLTYLQINDYIFGEYDIDDYHSLGDPGSSYLIKSLCRSCLPCLQTLYLQHATIYHKLPSFESCSSPGLGLQLTSLTKLDLRHSDIIEFSHIPINTLIQCLDLTDCQSKCKDIQDFSWIPDRFPNLTTLHLSSINRYNSQQVTDMIPKLSRLSFLFFPDYHETNDIYKQLHALFSKQVVIMKNPQF